MSKKEKLVAAGVDKLADMLLSLCEKNINVRREIGMFIAGLDENPNKIAIAIRKEINAFKRCRKDVSLKESADVSERLDKLRKNISTVMILKSPKTAFELMLEFLDLHEQTMERSDDSGGRIGDVFVTSCKDLGKISEKASLPQSQLVDIVFTRHMNDKYCICNDIVPDFANSLKKEGLLELKSKFENCLSSSDSGTAERGLQLIADAMKDVDAYIAVCLLDKEIRDSDIFEISRRLIDCGRSKEALSWLDGIKNNTSSVCRKLKVDAYESIGKSTEAQDERLIWFSESLTADVYKDILKAASEDFKANFKIDAIQKAYSFHDPHASISFLMEINELKELGNFICLRHGSLNGMNYRLRPAAELLLSSYPLAATLIYRKLINVTLDNVIHRHYKQAADDVEKCRMLSSKITDWESFQNHSEYLEGIQKTHKLKRSFWSYFDHTTSLSIPAPKRRKV